MTVSQLDSPAGACRTNTAPDGIPRMMRPVDWFTFAGSVTHTTAEFFNGSAVPLAPLVAAFADLTVRFPWGLSANASMTYVGNR